VYRLLVILGKSFSNFCGSRPDNMVLAHVIVGFAAEDLNSQSAFFYLLAIAPQTVIDDVSEQILATWAVLEHRMF
jgi:hypothetical protein